MTNIILYQNQDIWIITLARKNKDIDLQNVKIKQNHIANTKQNLRKASKNIIMPREYLTRGTAREKKRFISKKEDTKENENI